MKSFSKSKENLQQTQSRTSSTGSSATLFSPVYNTIIKDRKQMHKDKQERVR